MASGLHIRRRRSRPGRVGVFAALAALVVVALVVACSPVNSDKIDPATVDVIERCSPELGQPLEVKAVIDTLNRHGIALHPTDPQCEIPSVLVTASNMRDLWEGQDAISREQGDVSCNVEDDLSQPTVERLHFPGEAETIFQVWNVTCFLWPDGPEEDNQLARLATAMDELQQLGAKVEVGAT
jgi:hypothetical protein